MNKFLILIIIITLVILFFISSNISGFFTLKEPISYRPKHCIEDKCIDPIVFSKLPSYPKDFSKEINSPESFWKQPEFYNFESSIEYYINPPVGYRGYYGFGAYPSERRVTMKAGDERETFTYFHTSWFVNKYQGLKLNPVIDEEIKDYFDIEIEPEVILLEPTFPVFEYNWTQKIIIKIKAKDPPQGKYMIGVDASEPSLEYSQKWFEKYGNKYVEAGIFGVGRPFYQINVVI